MTDRSAYRSYLLRLWPAHTAGGVTWRASLEDSRSGTRIGFSSIRRLYEFLLDQTDDAPDPVVTGATDGVSFPVRPDDAPDRGSTGKRCSLE